MEDKAISEALGLESAFGYHIEQPPRPLLVGIVRERPPAPWYPCLDSDNTYHGCLGSACPLEVCWLSATASSQATWRTCRRRCAGGANTRGKPRCR